MNTQETAWTLVAGDKGMLAMDESNAICNRRFVKLGIPETTEVRRAYHVSLTQIAMRSTSSSVISSPVRSNATKRGVPGVLAIIGGAARIGIRHPRGSGSQRPRKDNRRRQKTVTSGRPNVSWIATW